MKKRVLSLLLVLLMVVSMVPMSALAYKSDTDVAYAVEGGNIYFDKSTGTITGSDESVTKASIPSEIDGVKVTSIGSSVFFNCTNLTSVDIPNSVTSIDSFAFVECINLTNVTMAYGVKSIGWGAFSGCKSLTSVTIPNSVTSIEGAAFIGCKSLKSVNIPESMTSIGAYVFAGCESFESINIPDSVTSIGSRAFVICTRLKSINIPNSVTNIGNGAFDCCESLSDVYYSGSEAQWNEISIDSANECLTNATIHYNWHTHSYTAVVTPPTCTEQGCTTYTCSCGDSYVDDYVGALGHKTELANAKEATCTEAGYTGDEICSVCGETISQGEEIEPAGHHYKGNTCVDCGEQRSTGDTIRAWFRDTAQQIKSFFDKIFGRN